MGAPLTQRAVQKRVGEELQKNELTRLRHNIVRSVFGKGDRPMEEILAETADSRARIIMLIAGIEEKGDVSKHALPAWYGMTQRDDHLLRNFQDMIERIDAQGEEAAKAAKALGIDRIREQVAFAQENPVKKATLEEYQEVVIRKVQEKLYGETPADISIVMNANADDFLQTVKRGGGNTTMITHAHSNRIAVAMTNSLVLGKEIEPPKEKLRAFLMHGCGKAVEKKDDTRAVIGTGLAEEVYTPEGCPVINHFIRDPFLRG